MRWPRAFASTAKAPPIAPCLGMVYFGYIIFIPLRAAPDGGGGGEGVRKRETGGVGGDKDSAGDGPIGFGEGVAAGEPCTMKTGASATVTAVRTGRCGRGGGVPADPPKDAYGDRAGLGVDILALPPAAPGELGVEGLLLLGGIVYTT